MKKQRGYTLFELLFAIVWMATIGLAFGVFYIGYHFLSKFW